MMHFAQPSILYLLWAVVPLAPVLFWMAGRRDAALRRFASDQLLPELTPGLNRKRLFGKNILLVGVFIFSVLALARPQWGFEWQEVKRRGQDILLVVDTSKSMLTADVKPNRLERTKLAIKDLLKKLKGDRVGLIAFAGDAFMVCPLTVDYAGFMLSLNDLDTRTVGRGGTNLSLAIKEAIRASLPEQGGDAARDDYKAVILITDGDDLEGDAMAAAREAKDKGIRIYSIGIGTPEGELIQFVNERGETEFLKDSAGNFVKSRLNENLLRQIALATGGVYARSSGAEFGLDFIYEHELSKLPIGSLWEEKRDIEQKMKKHYQERFQIPLAVAFILLLMETCFPTRKIRSVA